MNREQALRAVRKSVTVARMEHPNNDNWLVYCNGLIERAWMGYHEAMLVCANLRVSEALLLMGVSKAEAYRLAEQSKRGTVAERLKAACEAYQRGSYAATV